MERHREIGTRLQAMRDDLLALYVELETTKRVPERTAKAVSRLRAAWAAIDQARSHLEEIMFYQHGEHGGATIRTYYPEHKP